MAIGRFNMGNEIRLPGLRSGSKKPVIARPAKMKTPGKFHVPNYAVRATRLGGQKRGGGVK